jgi:putative chitinase
MISKYEKASSTRKRGLVGSITDRLVAGQGIGKSFGAGISDTLSAKTTGIKEKFDPLNIAKMFTGNLGMALFGKITGRKSEDMEYFLNKGRKKGEPYRAVAASDTKVGKVETAFYTNIREGQKGSLRKGDNVATVAARLVNIMKTFYEKEKLNSELARNFDEEILAEDQRRHDDLIKEINKVQNKPVSKTDLEKIKKTKQESKDIQTPTTEKPPTQPTAAPTTPSVPKTDKVPTQPATTPTTPSVPKTEKKVGESVTAVKPGTKEPSLAQPVATPKTETKPTLPSTAIKESAPKTSAVSTAAKVAVGAAAATAGINDALAEVGITNEFAKQAILANVNKESGFQTVGENLNYTTAKRVREVFPSVTGQMTDDQIEPYLKNPEKLSELVYGYQTPKGKDLGNKEPGDAWKFRGRGLIQLTGRYNYEKIGKALNIDLVKDPELVNDPAIAPKVVAVFIKQKLKDKINNFTNQKDANKDITKAIVGSNVDLTKGIGAEQLAKVENYTTKNSGERVYASSSENQELKQEPSVTNVAVNNTKTIINTSNKQPKVLSGPQIDDYPVLASNIT